MQESDLPLPPGDCPSPLALQVWNECGGLDWNALEIVAEIHGCTDIDVLVAELLAIRAYAESKRG